MKKLMLVAVVINVVIGWSHLMDGNFCQAMMMFGAAGFLAKQLD